MEKSGQRPNEYFIYAQLLAYATAKPKEPARAERCIRNALEDWGSLGAVGGGWEAKGARGDVNLYTMGCDLGQLEGSNFCEKIAGAKRMGRSFE